MLVEQQRRRVRHERRELVELTRGVDAGPGGGGELRGLADGEPERKVGRGDRDGLHHAHRERGGGRLGEQHDADAAARFGQAVREGQGVPGCGIGDDDVPPARQQWQRGVDGGGGLGWALHEGGQALREVRTERGRGAQHQDVARDERHEHPQRRGWECVRLTSGDARVTWRVGAQLGTVPLTTT
ncbi:hypothetical protein LRS13_00555 [Svornostia abyssi]|uniref:Uncharacterized protein n=1 Tax=Svornostia abyssi TaxID=2898438 RepID=A0ABY5PHH6_9ACTN|nr:hypothetical protein LRS13_00555 [Parviterribacteraceae bacterium J379]